jgi:AbrB family looped-hinge helix DNA binding protein
MSAMLLFCISVATDPIVQVSGRGTVTLPAAVRRSLGIAEGDVLTVKAEAGRIVLAPAVVMPVELYDEERLREFAENAELTDAELGAATRRWTGPSRRG